VQNDGIFFRLDRTWYWASPRDGTRITAQRGSGVAALVAGAMVDGAGEIRGCIPRRIPKMRTSARATRAESGRRGRASGLAAIYVGRGLDATLAKQVAEQLIAR